TDNAVFPFARYVMTLEDVPPGAHPTRITPTAISGGSWNSMTSPSAMIGMIAYWAITTINTILGAFNTLLKSSVFKVSPMPNMIIPRSKLISAPIHVKPPGNKNDITANKITQTAKVFPTNWLNLATAFITDPPYWTAVYSV